jgi:hypothetical protein
MTMDRRIFMRILPATMALVPNAWAQTAPDFSGVWMVDNSRSDPNPYGQIRVIHQNIDAIDFTSIEYVRNPRMPNLNVVPWKLRFNRWGPRRGKEDSREPKVQARWDGSKLIYVKSPGESFSALVIWSLGAPDELLVEGVSWTSIPQSFQFTERAIPSAYARSRHYYRRVADVTDWAPETDGSAVSLRLEQNVLNVTCLTGECRAYEIVSGRRIASRKHAEGSVFKLSLTDQTTVELERSGNN